MPASAAEWERAEARRLLMLSIDEIVEQTIRVQRISQTMRMASAVLCGEAPLGVLGLAVVDVDDLPDVLQALALERFGPADRLHVVGVFEGMPADSSGLQPGDQILSSVAAASRPPFAGCAPETRRPTSSRSGSMPGWFACSTMRAWRS